MPEERTNYNAGEEAGDGRRALRNAVIVFAIIEALVVIPLALYVLFHKL